MQFYTLAADINLGEIGANMDGRYLQFCDATGGVVASLQFDTPALGTPASGSVSVNPMVSDTSSAGGTIAYANITDGTGGDYYYLTVDTTGTPDILIPSLTVAPGIEVALDSGTFAYNTVD